MAIRMSGMKFGIIFVGFWTLIVGFFDCFIGYGIWRQVQSQNWPQAIGAISHSEIVTSSDDDGTTYRPKIRFNFSVDGQWHHGDGHRFTAMGTSDHSYARSVVDRYPVGREVVVYYDPHDPSRAVLENGIASTDLAIAQFLTPFNIIMIGGWMFLTRGLLYRVTRAQAGGVSIRKRGMRTHVRLPRFSPITAALATALGVSFVSVFVLAFSFGMDPPMWVIGTTWGLTLGLAAVVFVWRAFVVGSGRKDLVIDDEHAMVSLPQTFGRVEDVLVPIESVTDIDVERIAHSSDSGTSYTWAPRLQWDDDRGKAQSSKLAEWHNEHRAESLAAWLRERLGIHRRDRTDRAAHDAAPPLLDI